jgi:hypothetical protein
VDGTVDAAISQERRTLQQVVISLAATERAVNRDHESVLFDHVANAMPPMLPTLAIAGIGSCGTDLRG